MNETCSIRVDDNNLDYTCVENDDNNDNDNDICEQQQQQQHRIHPNDEMNNNNLPVVDDDDNNNERDGLMNSTTSTGSTNNNNDTTTNLSTTGTSSTDLSLFTSTWIQYISNITNIPLLLSDDIISIVGIHHRHRIVLLDNTFIIKLVKFTIFTYTAIAFWYWWVRYINWEHDTKLQLQDIWTYEGTLIFNDIILFYLVGRIYEKNGVDTIQYVLIILFANIYSSYITDFTLFQHSFTLYEMNCTWPVPLWIFVLMIIPFIIYIAYKHVYYAYEQFIIIQKCIEILLCLIVTLVPYINSSYFHLHHWYAGLLIGMHCNYNKWWSSNIQTWCWGLYINGISVYGRDPVLTCGYALFISQDQNCPFVQCYTDALQHIMNTTENTTIYNNITKMDTPDWRNCSSSYKP